jgi:hypothetical protein
LSYYVPEQKLGGGATGHAKRAGRRSNPKFDDYTQNSSDLQSKFKNESFCEILAKLKDFYFCNFL